MCQIASPPTHRSPQIMTCCHHRWEFCPLFCQLLHDTNHWVSNFHGRCLRRLSSLMPSARHLSSSRSQGQCHVYEVSVTAAPPREAPIRVLDIYYCLAKGLKTQWLETPPCDFLLIPWVGALLRVPFVHAVAPYGFGLGHSPTCSQPVCGLA